MTDFNQPSSNNRPLIPIDALTQIAKQYLDIDTLEERRRDALDFYDCAVWSIKAALKESYLLGQRSAQVDLSERLCCTNRVKSVLPLSPDGLILRAL